MSHRRSRARRTGLSVAVPAASFDTAGVPETVPVGVATKMPPAADVAVKKRFALLPLLGGSTTSFSTTARCDPEGP